MKIAIASDHGGFALKNILKQHLEEAGYEVSDCGTDSEESCDYPDFAEKACRQVQSGGVSLAVLICGTGIGMSIAANKMKGIRAALCMMNFQPGLPVPIMMPMYWLLGRVLSVRDWPGAFWMCS